jgi:hypothetical protein
LWHWFEIRGSTHSTQSLKKLTAVVSTWSDKPLVDREVVDAAQHPYGDSRFDNAKEQAAKDFPKETETLLLALGEWRAALKTAILESGK